VIETVSFSSIIYDNLKIIIIIINLIIVTRSVNKALLNLLYQQKIMDFSLMEMNSYLKHAFDQLNIKNL
jgi:hypothetical protein